MTGNIAAYGQIWCWRRSGDPFILICRQQGETVYNTESSLSTQDLKAHPHSDMLPQTSPQFLIVPFPMGHSYSNYHIIFKQQQQNKWSTCKDYMIHQLESWNRNYVHRKSCTILSKMETNQGECFNSSIAIPWRINNQQKKIHKSLTHT